MLEELKSRNDELAFDRLLARSTVECQAFRISLLEPLATQASIEILSEACRAFKVQAAEPLKNRASISSFQLDKTKMRERVVGDSSTLESGPKIYEAFQGKWFGRWTDFEVDHHWDSYVPLSEPRTFELKHHPLNLIGYQYAWVGDGYAVNHLATSETKSKNAKTAFLLGYVVHLKEGDLSKETNRRPHIGIIDGPDRLIWITKGEVFLEQVIRDKSGTPSKYTITGFRYKFSGGKLLASEGFQAIYSKASDRRQSWFGFPLNIEIHSTESVRDDATK